MAKNTAIIIRDKELIEKVDKLKEMFGYKTRTKTINELVKQAYINNLQYKEYREKLNSLYWIPAVDLIKANK